MDREPDDRDSLRSDPAFADALIEEQEEAAAAEAAGIGGANPAPDTDPAARPVEEAGGGVAEGFEQAEEALVRQASHEDPGTSPTQEQFSSEEEDAPLVAGEPDEVDPTEVTSDPAAGHEDPGEGPGIAAEADPRGLPEGPND